MKTGIIILLSCLLVAYIIYKRSANKLNTATTGGITSASQQVRVINQLPGTLYTDPATGKSTTVGAPRGYGDSAAINSYLAGTPLIYKR